MKTNAALIANILIATTFFSGTILASTLVSADNDSVVDEINITVQVSCTMTGTGMDSHNATINNGQYNSAIGETTMKAFCNDSEGFAIYAIGYTDNINGKNVLTSPTLGSTHDIITGTGISGNTSNWAMKLATVSNPTPTYPISIENSFDSFHAVPDTHTLVAKRTAGTDIGESAEGSTLTSTYQAYISPTQAAGTYTGQVKYTLIHPHDEPAPPDSMLDIGRVVNAKMKTLAAGAERTYSDTTADIKAIHMASSLPVGFEATSANTVSTIDSKYPIYIFFDNTDDVGVMYFYTENETVIMNPNSSNIFGSNVALVDISGLADWDASNVTNMHYAFGETALTDVAELSNWDTRKTETMSAMFAYNSTLNDISGLTNWNTSNVTNMYAAFYGSGLTSLHGLEDWDVSRVNNLGITFSANTSLIDISALENWDVTEVKRIDGIFNGDGGVVSLHGLEKWDTSNVENMRQSFGNMTSLSDASALINWDTSSVTNMQTMFGGDKALPTINVSNWNTSNVVNMASMFSVGDSHAGNGQLREIIGIENWDVSNVTNMTSMFYGAGQMTHYDIANWDVSKVESFNHMFCDNFKLESLDLSRWNVSSLKTITNMFDDNYKLTTIGDVSHWNTHNLIDASGWLNGATSFVGNDGTLDLSGWNTTNLKAAEEMFRAVKLRIIDLSSWTFDSITNDGWEGAGSGIYYSYGTGLDVMFKDTAQLNNVYVSQSGLNSFNAAVNNGIDITNMWSGSGASGFTVKP